MTKEQFLERFTWTISDLGCWLDVRGESISIQMPQNKPRAALRKSENAGVNSIMAIDRIAYEIFREKLSPRAYIAHSCKNPMCIKPDHAIVTSGENGKRPNFKGIISKICKTCKEEKYLEFFGDRPNNWGKKTVCIECEKKRVEIKTGKLIENEKMAMERKVSREAKKEYLKNRKMFQDAEDFCKNISWTENENGCWIIEIKPPVSLHKGKGYATINRNGCYMNAHKAAYIFLIGPVDDGMCIMHSCDTPLCINPKHLSQGTRSDNTQDMLSKGRSGHSTRKLMQKQHDEIRASDKSSYVLADIYNVTPTHIRRIKNGSRC